LSVSGILLDTNVLSELMRARPAAEVLNWFSRQADARYFVSAITRAEILLGIALLPAGQRRDGLASAAEQMFDKDFSGCTLSFDDNCADEYALIVADRTRRGRAMSTEDGQIAATALSHELPLATRNVKDFAGIQRLTIINPWA
jgi:toxin FitB